MLMLILRHFFLRCFFSFFAFPFLSCSLIFPLPLIFSAATLFFADFSCWFSSLSRFRFDFRWFRHFAFFADAITLYYSADAVALLMLCYWVTAHCRYAATSAITPVYYYYFYYMLPCRCFFDTMLFFDGTAMPHWYFIIFYTLYGRHANRCFDTLITPCDFSLMLSRAAAISPFDTPFFAFFAADSFRHAVTFRHYYYLRHLFSIAFIPAIFALPCFDAFFRFSYAAVFRHADYFRCCHACCFSLMLMPPPRQLLMLMLMPLFMMSLRGTLRRAFAFATLYCHVIRHNTRQIIVISSHRTDALTARCFSLLIFFFFLSLRLFFFMLIDTILRLFNIE